jgi:NTE family protein
MASDLTKLPLEPVQQSAVPAKVRSGSALCLSGGGYRAALFHLGVCRRLNEVGILSSLDAISSVSGGSIFAAHMAKCIIDSNATCFADYEHSVARPFRAFVKNDIRTTPALARLLPWEWANAGAGAESLAEQYRQHLVGEITLGNLPDRPHFNFCATDLVFGVNWIFSKGRVGDYQAGYMTEANSNKQQVAVAVAASSCFPPVFRGLPLGLEPRDLTGGDAPQGSERDEWVRQIALSDGGVYDNMALEPIWKNFASIIVSDGGKPFTFAKENDTPHQLYRIQDVIGNQSQAVRKRWLIANSSIRFTTVHILEFEMTSPNFQPPAQPVIRNKLPYSFPLSARTWTGFRMPRSKSWRLTATR